MHYSIRHSFYICRHILSWCIFVFPIEINRKHICIYLLLKSCLSKTSPLLVQICCLLTSGCCSIVHFSHFIKNFKSIFSPIDCRKENFTTETLKTLACTWQSKRLSLLCSQHSLGLNQSWHLSFFIFSPTLFPLGWLLFWMITLSCCFLHKLSSLEQPPLVSALAALP